MGHFESKILNPHQLSAETLLTQLQSSKNGLSQSEAQLRLDKFGPNKLPTQKPPHLFKIFLHQFTSPLVYLLAGAAVISIALDGFTDALFIGVVVLFNAILGCFQEFNAEKSAQALRQMSRTKALVLRDGSSLEIDSEELVPGDIVKLETGRKVPADLRLLSDQSLEIDESLLTGESLSSLKDSTLQSSDSKSLGDRKNIAFAGTLVTRGRGQGLVIATALHTELGEIANSISFGESAPPPLLIRMEKFSKKIVIVLILIIGAMASFLIFKGQSWHEVLMFSIALTVSAIPEGLPIALTIALSIASRRMSRRNVIVRKLPAVEALGSCTYIATDKTGTLTLNQLTIQKMALPDFAKTIEVRGSGLNPEGGIEAPVHLIDSQILPLVRAGVLCNESHLSQTGSSWVGRGDSVDLAFLVLGKKLGIDRISILSEYKSMQELPFEAENQFAASLHLDSTEHGIISIKGALERILPLCTNMFGAEGQILALDPSSVLTQSDTLASQGFKVLALAGKDSVERDRPLSDQLKNLTFYGLVGMIDPLRPEAKEAIQSCQTAGITVAMLTGDHPKTAFAIAQQLNLTQREEDLISGTQIRQATSPEEKALLFNRGRVFARVDPQQKLEIVQYLLKNGRFVAVTGDGANDAPSLRAANVGIAMGQSGTDVAKETSDLIITDDRFASIVAGIEEGRVAYANIRKVIYLLTATGAAEIFLFLLSFIFNTPLPLTAVQILWMNLVTNGIQDIGIALEPAEGDELKRKPRKPTEPIFDRLMIERVLISALVMGGLSFWQFYSLVQAGIDIDMARNITLLLMVLFSNIMVGNCRSETKSAFFINPFKNPFLLGGTLLVQALHIATMYIPGFREILGVQPVSLAQWSQLLFIALSIFVVMELHKLMTRSRSQKQAAT